MGEGTCHVDSGKRNCKREKRGERKEAWTAHVGEARSAPRERKKKKKKKKKKMKGAKSK